MRDSLKLYTKRVVTRDLKTQSNPKSILGDGVIEINFLNHKAIGVGLVFFLLEFTSGCRPRIIFSKKDHQSTRAGDLLSLVVKLRKPYPLLEKFLYVVLTREMSEKRLSVGSKQCYINLSLLGLFFETNQEFARLGGFLALDPMVVLSFSVKTKKSFDLSLFFRHYQLKFYLRILTCWFKPNRRSK